MHRALHNCVTVLWTKAVVTEKRAISLFIKKKEVYFSIKSIAAGEKVARRYSNVATCKSNRVIRHFFPDA